MTATRRPWRSPISAIEYPDADEIERRARAVFGPVDLTGATTEECWRHYASKLPRLAGWARPAIPSANQELGVGEEQARWAFRNAYVLRDRFSVADLLAFTGRLDDAFVNDDFARTRDVRRG
jgi:hypothetical protein